MTSWDGDARAELVHLDVLLEAGKEINRDSVTSAPVQSRRLLGCLAEQDHLLVEEPEHVIEVRAGFTLVLLDPQLEVWRAAARCPVAGPLRDSGHGSQAVLIEEPADCVYVVLVHLKLTL